MASDVTSNTASLYNSLKRTLEDLNRLGADFGAALRDEGYDFSVSDEYSYSPNSLVLKKSHAWFFHLPRDAQVLRTDGVLNFAAAFVYFEGDKAKWKLSAPGRPELWFFIGKVTPPPADRWPSTIHTFFDLNDLKSYKTKPKLGGSVHVYAARPPPDHWDAVCLGFEIGEIHSPELLKEKAVVPLLAAAKKEGLLES